MLRQTSTVFGIEILRFQRFLNGCVDLFICLMYNECALSPLKLKGDIV